MKPSSARAMIESGEEENAKSEAIARRQALEDSRAHIPAWLILFLARKKMNRITKEKKLKEEKHET